MESQPPPGYNPNVSLLEGGTDVRIMPVQGGGGLGSDYNHTVSLLEGGNEAPIQAVRGGAVTFADKNEVTTYNPTNKPSNLLKAKANTNTSKDKDTKANTKEKKGFKGDPNAVKAETAEVEISRDKFALRKPTDSVKKDWLAGKYSQGEADFLNTLQLSQDLLESIYNKSWKSEVSLFLETMSVASCFKDHQLLLKSECDASRSFLQKVYFKNYSNTIDELYTEWGSKTPSENSKDVLNKLIQAISSLSASTVGEVEMTTITENEFQGDPAGRYIKMDVDTDRDTPSYFANFVEEVDGKKTYTRIYGEPKDIITQYKELKKGKTSKNKSTSKLDSKLKTLKNSYKGMFSKLLGKKPMPPPPPGPPPTTGAPATTASTPAPSSLPPPPPGAPTTTASTPPKKMTLKNRALKGINNVTKKLDNNKVKSLSEYAKKKVKEAQNAKKAAENASIKQGTNALQLKQKERKIEKEARVAELSSLKALYDVANKAAEKEEEKAKTLTGREKEDSIVIAGVLRGEAEKASKALENATTKNKKIDEEDKKLTEPESKINEYEVRIDKAIQEANKLMKVKDKVIEQAQKAKDAANTATKKGTKKNIFGKSYINSAKTSQDKIEPAEQAVVKAFNAVLKISKEVKDYYNTLSDELKNETKGQIDQIDKKSKDIEEKLKDLEGIQQIRASNQAQKQQEKNAATIELTRATETLQKKTTELTDASKKEYDAKLEFETKSKERKGKPSGDPSIAAKVQAEMAYNKAKRELEEAKKQKEEAEKAVDKAKLLVELYTLKGGKYRNRNRNRNRKTRKVRKI